MINPGLLSSLQDGGRYGYQEYGMPVAGAMDTYSLVLANWCVGNNPYEACIEATVLGPEIEFLHAATIAVCGASVSVYINGSESDMNRSLFLNKGDNLSFGNTIQGSRIYIAIAGGFNVPVIMGSKSTYLRGKIGGFKGRALMAEDKLEFNESDIVRKRSIPIEYLPEFNALAEIRIISGPEINTFTMEGIQNFLCSTYKVSPQSDRMGYRLNGSKIQHHHSADIISSGLSNGAVQVPGHGEPIIMLADHQTIGGYTRIANVISADLPILGQMMPGNSIRFKEVKLEVAQQLFREQSQKLNYLFST